MKRILFYIFYVVNWTITLLPLNILYFFSDLAYIIMYHIVGYRRKVVFTNLTNSFPDKTPGELIRLEKKFYRHLCDLFVEGLKSTHMSGTDLKKRMKLINPGIIDEQCPDNLEIFLMSGHHGNWEWMASIPLFITKHQFISIYKPLKNVYFDKFMLRLRSKTGAELVPSHSILREIIRNRESKRYVLYLSIADQTPPKGEIKYWTSFMNQDTPVFTGTGRLAVKYGIPVYFISIKKIKRGYYTFAFEPLIMDTKGLSEFEIMEIYTKRLEREILESPELYLWSHRRWKHKRNSVSINDRD